MPKVKVPTHRLHKASGRGFVMLSGEQHYTGAWGSPDASRAFDALVMRWIAGGRRPLRKKGGEGPTVAEVCNRHVEALGRECVKRGGPTSYARHAAQALHPAVVMFGATPAAEFGHERAAAVRDYWLRATSPRTGRRLARRTVAARTTYLVAAFKRAARLGEVPAVVVASLGLLEPLKRGGPDGAGPKRVAPADDDDVGRVVAGVRSRALGGMIRLQRLTGMRPAEVCAMRLNHLREREDGVVEYRVPPEWNKNEHRGRDRVVYLGPKAMEVLRPFLEAARRRGPKAAPFLTQRGTPYSRGTYYMVVRQACQRLGVAPWSPNRLRHSRLTEVDEALGLEAAAAVGGHAGVETTRGYTERARETLAARVAREMG